MKLALLSVLILISVVAFAFADSNSITVITDKASYLEGETILITGEVSHLLRGSALIHIVTAPNGNIASMEQLIVSADKKFSTSLDAGGELMEIVGTYTVTVNYGEESGETTFELLPPHIQLYTNKQSYNEIETIQITGNTTLPTTNTDRIAITLYDNHDNILIPESLIPLTNNIFSHSITTDTIQWDNYVDNVKISAQLQGHIVNATIHYSSYPANLSLESIYDMADNNGIMINGMYEHAELLADTNTQRDVLIASLNTSILSLISQLDDMKKILETLTDMPDAPIISVPPVILSIVADDPDDLDNIFSIDDTITILFDSDTNRPGGVNAQTKAEINNLFTFTEQIGQTYRGKWLTPDTFEITIKSIRQGVLTIGTTTVTPTETTPILSADYTSTPSNATSPVLIGDWGMP